MDNQIDTIFTPSDKTYLPQTTVKLLPKNGQSYESTSTNSTYVEFEISPTLGYFVSEKTMLNFNFEFTGDRAHLRPQQNGGMAGMIRSINVYGLNSGTLLEEINEYHILNSVLYSGMVGATDNLQDPTYSALSNTECYCYADQSYTPFTVPNAYPFSPGTPTTDPMAYNTQKILLPIRLSSILGSGGAMENGIFPLGAVGGLRVRFELRNTPDWASFNSLDINEAVTVAPWFYAVNGNPTGVNSLNFKVMTGWNDIVIAPAVIPAGLYTLTDLETAIQGVAGLADVTLAFTAGSGGQSVTMSSVAGVGAGVWDVTNNILTHLFRADPTTGVVIPAGGSVDVPLAPWANGSSHTAIPLRWKSLKNCNPNDFNTCPFSRSQKLQLQFSGPGAGVTNFYASVNGNITTMSREIVTNADGTQLQPTGGNPIGFGDVILLNTTAPQGWNWNYPNQNADRTVGADFTAQGSLDTAPIKSVNLTNVGFKMTDVSLSMCIVSPPPSYVSSMFSAINSDKGLSIPLNQFNLLRTSSPVNESLAQMLLPYPNKRARSIISIPNTPGESGCDVLVHANKAQIIKPTKVYYSYNNIRHPAQGINTEVFTNGMVNNEPSFSQELIQSQVASYEYSLGKMRSLMGYSNSFKELTFFFGKNLGILNTVMDVSDANLSLTVEATSDGTGFTAPINFAHYLYSEHALNIKSSGVTLFK